jgi:hypothetical protein
MEPRVEDWFKKHFKLKKKIERKKHLFPKTTPPPPQNKKKAFSTREIPK